MPDCITTCPDDTQWQQGVETKGCRSNACCTKWREKPQLCRCMFEHVSTHALIIGQRPLSHMHLEWLARCNASSMATALGCSNPQPCCSKGHLMHAYVIRSCFVMLNSVCCDSCQIIHPHHEQMLCSSCRPSCAKSAIILA